MGLLLFSGAAIIGSIIAVVGVLWYWNRKINKVIADIPVSRKERADPGPDTPPPQSTNEREVAINHDREQRSPKVSGGTVDEIRGGSPEVNRPSPALPAARTSVERSSVQTTTPDRVESNESKPSGVKSGIKSALTRFRARRRLHEES